MFDDGAVLTTQDLESLVAVLRRVEEQVGDAERIDQLAALERVKAAAAAAQARVTAAFVESQAEVAEQWQRRAAACSAAGDFEGWQAARDQADRATVRPAEDTEADEATGAVGAARAAGAAGAAGADRATTTSGKGAAGRRGRRRAGQGVSAQVALARRESPSRGAHHVTFALRLVHEMPHTLAALEAGLLSEWRAMIVSRETAELSGEHRAAVDAEVAGRLRARLGTLSDRELARRVRAVAYRVDPASVMARSTQAQADRRVTIRPAPDTMAYVTALLPVAQAVATHAALTAAADTARAAGDDRSKGQVMADELVTRVTGQQQAQDVPIEIQLVMTDRALFGGDDVPAQLHGYGTVPAAWVRRLLAAPEGGDDAGRSRAAAWLRRLYTSPTSDDLVAMDSARRTFDGGLRRFVVTRDGATCRTPWCDAPVRHIDHVQDHADGGPTSVENGQSLCVRCNHTKQLPEWSAARAPDVVQWPTRHTVVTTTPTGHSYSSHAPPLVPGLVPDPSSPIELYFARLLGAA